MEAFIHTAAFSQLPARKIERDFFMVSLAKRSVLFNGASTTQRQRFEFHPSIQTIPVNFKFVGFSSSANTFIIKRKFSKAKYCLCFYINPKSVELETNSVHIFLCLYLGNSLSISFYGAIHPLIKTNIGISFPLYITGIDISVLLWGIL